RLCNGLRVDSRDAVRLTPLGSRCRRATGAEMEGLRQAAVERPWTFVSSRRSYLGSLQERAAAVAELLSEHVLHALADDLGDLQHELRVLRSLGPVLRRGHRLAERDDPLRRQRDGAEGPEQREERRDGEVREVEQLR